MSDNEEINEIFNKRQPVELTFTTEQNVQYLLKHMRPTSISYSAKKGGTIDVNLNFTQYHPTKYELFKDWLLYKLKIRKERYW